MEEGDADVGGGMEAGGQREVNVEAMEVDHIIPSRKTEQLYEMHEKQFLAICPEKIWIKILGKLNNDPDAQTNCANVSPYFWELLKKDRVLFLFPKVVEVIAPKATERDFGIYVEATEDSGDYKEQEDYFWTKKEAKNWRASVLECRLVCSAWNKAVEECYESCAMAGQTVLLAKSENNLDPRSPAIRMRSGWTSGLFQFDSFWIIKHFVKEFEFLHFFNLGLDGPPPPKNPFFGRYIKIVVAREEHYNNMMTRLLQLFGNQVWYCAISWISPTTAKEVSSELVKWLWLLPNLKILGMEGPNSVKGLSRKDFQTNPFPKLDKLEMLEFNKTSGLIMSEVLRVNCHVKVLTIMDIDFDGGMDLTVGQLLTNLKSFEPLGSKSGHKMLDQVGHRWKQLSHLYLDEGSKYFGKLETNWAQTLTELDLQRPFGLDKATILKQSKNLRLKLHRIRRLSLQITGLYYLDFIEPMQGSLEHLELIGIDFFREGCTIGDRNKVKKEQRIELLGYEEKMHESNVWKLFAKLETIRLVNFRKELHLIFSKEGKKYLLRKDDEEDADDEGETQEDEDDTEGSDDACKVQ